MKKLLVLMIAVIMSIFALAGCSSTDAGEETGSAEPAASAESLDVRTIGDVIALDRSEEQTAVGNGKVVYAFKYGDTYYRVTAEIPKETEQAYQDVDILKEGYEQKQEELVAPLEVSKVENLSEQMLSQEELDALAGKTGRELVDEGWAYQGSFMLDDMEVSMNYGPFLYQVKFDGNVDVDEVPDDFDIEKTTKDMKVKSAGFSALGDGATDPE